MSRPGRGAQRLLAILAAGVLSGCTGVAGPVRTPPPPPPAVSPSPIPTHTTPAPVASAATPTAAPPTPSLAVRPPRVRGVLNFRDVAGWKASLPVAGGGSMARGVVYRSGRLKDLTDADRRELVRAGVSYIIDLRTTQVARRSPDPAIKGARYRHVNLFGVYSTGTPRYASATEAIADRLEMNRRFVSDPGQRKRTASVLKIISRASGPVIIHCTEGKDRTGWIAALLQLIAGASEADVMADYLASNRFRHDAVEARYAKVLKARGRKAADIDRLLYIVDESYLLAGLEELRERYGDLDTFVSEGLGVSADTVTALRARLRDD